MDKSLLTGLFLLSLLLRAGVAVGIHSYLEKSGRSYLIAGDADGYWKLGQSLINEGKYQVYEPPRQVMRMPGYPLLIAFITKLIGPSLLAVRLIQSLLASLGVVLVVLLGRELFDPQTGYLAGLILAISPAVIGFSALILSETLFAVMLLLNLFLVAQWIRSDTRRPTWRASLLIGVSTTLAVYVRPTWLPTLAVWGLISVWKRPSTQGLRDAVIIMLAGFMTLAPWCLRNYAVTGHWVLTTLWVGPSLYDSLNPDADGSSDMAFFDREQVMSKEGMTEFEMDRYYRSRTRDFVNESPIQAIGLMLSHTKRYWSLIPNANQFQNQSLAVPLGLWNAIFMALSLYGLCFFFSRLVPLILVAGPLFGFALVHAVFVGSLRYRLPAEYPLCIAAAVGLLAVISHFRTSPSSDAKEKEVTG